MADYQGGRGGRGGRGRDGGGGRGGGRGGILLSSVPCLHRLATVRCECNFSASDIFRRCSLLYRSS